MRHPSVRFVHLQVLPIWPLAAVSVLSAIGCTSSSASQGVQEGDVVEVADVQDSDDSATTDGNPRSVDSASVDDGSRSADSASTHDSLGAVDSRSDSTADSNSFDDGQDDAGVDSCADGWFHYVDKSCFPSRPDVPDLPCAQKGDGKCYLKCTSEADCSGVGMPCITLSLYNDGSSPCNKKAQVCGPQAMHKNCL